MSSSDIHYCNLGSVGMIDIMLPVPIETMDLNSNYILDYTLYTIQCTHRSRMHYFCNFFIYI